MLDIVFAKKDTLDCIVISVLLAIEGIHFVRFVLVILKVPQILEIVKASVSAK